MTWLDVSVIYTDYVLDCKDNEITPLDEKEWYEEIFLKNF